MEGDEIFKVTALLYFKDALVKQEFESCKELVDIAKQYGAEQSEIDEVVTGFLRGDKTAGKQANRIKNLQLLKEEQ
jgi:hypothetical protein